MDLDRRHHVLSSSPSCPNTSFVSGKHLAAAERTRGKQTPAGGIEKLWEVKGAEGWDEV